MPRPAKVKVQVPTSLEEAGSLVHQIGEEQRTLGLIEAVRSEAIARANNDAVVQSQPHQKIVADLFAALYSYAANNRAELTRDGRVKTIKVSGGEFYWRLTPPSVLLTKPEGDVISVLCSLGLGRFVITKVSKVIDKRALAREPKVVAGVHGVVLEQHEEFVVEPSGAVAVKKRTEKLNAAKSRI